MYTKERNGMKAEAAIAMRPGEFDYCFMIKVSFSDVSKLPDLALVSKAMFETEEDTEKAIYDSFNTLFDWDEADDNSIKEFTAKMEKLYDKYDVTVTTMDNVILKDKSAVN